jgi:hypothetical protein
MNHVSDEELLLEYYGEASPDQRASMRAHLEGCEECRAVDRELRAVLALVNAEPLPDAPPGFEHAMWARVEPLIAKPVVSGFTRMFWSVELPRWALAAAAVALAAGSFALGRVWEHPSAPSIAVDDMRSVSERMLRSDVEEHLERSQRVLVELVNSGDAAPAVLAGDRERAADLVAAGRLYRHSVEEIGDAETRDLLEDVERVLVEIANGAAGETSNDLSEVRARISNQDLIFRLRVTTAEMRARERRATPTW